MMIKPLVHPKSIHDESPIGYLVRLAEENAYDGYSWLFDNQSERYKTIKLADFDGFLRNQLWCGYKDNLYRKELLSLSDKHLSLMKIRFCPLCLQENNYWKVEWHQRIYVACPDHKVWMIEDCPNCGKPFEVRHSKLSQCECEFDFRESNVTTTSEDVLTLMRFLRGDDNELGRELGFEAGELSITERSNLIHFMARQTKPSGIRTHGNNQDLLKLESAKANMINLVSAFFSGEQPFERYLKSLILNDDNKKQGLLSFVHFYKELYSTYPGGYFHEHKKIIEASVNLHWRREINNRNRYFSSYVKDNHPWIPLARAVRVYGIKKSVINRCVMNNLFQTIVTAGEKRRFILLYKPDIEKTLPVINDVVDAKAAAVILGVSRSQLKMLVDRQEFKHAMPPIEGFCPTWQFMKSELEGYVNSLVVDAVPPSGESITVFEMMSYFSARADNLLLNVLDAFRNKTLVVERPISERNLYEQGIRSLGTNKDAFQNWYLDKFTDDKYLSISKVAHKLGINQEFAYQLVNYDFLKTSTDSKNIKIRKVSLTQLEDFKQEYVLLSKLSLVLEQSSTHVSACLRYLNVYPIDHEMEIKLRQKVYKRQSIAKLPQYSSLIESMEA